MDSTKEAFLNQKIEELEKLARKQKSQTLNMLIDLKVMLEDDDIDEAIKLLAELTE